jgi:hypothetical protein
MRRLILFKSSFIIELRDWKRLALPDAVKIALFFDVR